jgi:hypothetical protein
MKIMLQFFGISAACSPVRVSLCRHGRTPKILQCKAALCRFDKFSIFAPLFVGCLKERPLSNVAIDRLTMTPYCPLSVEIRDNIDKRETVSDESSC